MEFIVRDQSGARECAERKGQFLPPPEEGRRILRGGMEIDNVEFHPRRGERPAQAMVGGTAPNGSVFQLWAPKDLAFGL